MAGTTIQNILALPSPVFTLTGFQTRAVGHCDKWERVQMCHVRQWDDFNVSNISSAFGDLLDQPASVAMGGLCANRGVRNLGEMKNHAIDWLLGILESPLAAGSRLLSHRLGSASAIDHSRDTTFPGAKHKYESSLIFYLDSSPRIHFVVSCARLSSQWTSEGLKNQEPAAVIPIRQLATYAKESGTRYSFIMTDKEVVVVRFIVDSTGQYRAEWQAIPGYASGEGSLTVGLAVWALIMMSLNEKHRAVTTEAETLPINLWWREQGVDGRFTYRHHLSGRELPYLHSGAVHRDS
ncbi:uncharacterized protein NECHADRAFT_88134 [Fusarium vanettenii 77-13-4]|uniref:Uncharacterized protein n=1 Tax=Fusarium vanettenii (strain ATCC MYA-4622 / CBS 123669 / FGSC 9596 / NRRL 45880 / 77-13-4) TaxID=660122 RepID=C7ZDU4_FUSV7|nr:uncharacterized protein NECHADRAFT_88134 [Fusarium vanettenii 77-13-4]EEU37753.1 predicted protein [Fusarium vanettenii 77-13-4]